MSSRAEVSRRQFLISSGVAVAAACLAPPRLFSQEGLVGIALKESATAKITVQALRRNISVLQGPGGNIAVLTGPDGKLLVDAEIVTARSNVTAALASINADPIKQLINTHWHFDHTGGNEWLHQAGASILAHENTRKRLSVDTRVEGWFYTFPAAPAGAIPTTVFQDEHTVHVNGSTLALKYYGPAHTDSDISVHFTEADVLHTGDTFWNRNYPFIDYSTGGSIDGQIRAAEANLAKVSATHHCDSRPWRSHGESRPHAVSRCAGRGARESRQAQEAGQDIGRGDRSQTHRPLRRGVGAILSDSQVIFGMGVSGRLDRDCLAQPEHRG